MRSIKSEVITETVAQMVIKANKILPDSLCKKIEESKDAERDPLCKSVFCDLCDNIDAAKELNIPVCQDTGMAVIFAEIGQDLHIEGDTLEEAINKGVAKGYVDGLLRKSVVADPINRQNTGNNTPAIIHISTAKGDKLKLIAAPKGFGSENMSGIKMLKPTATEEEIINAVVEIVKKAGSNPCPPMVVGVGIGGDFEYSAILSKKALCRDVSVRNDDPYYASLEEKMLNEINKLKIGAQGFGGDITALAVNIEKFATHIAGLPVAVNIGCHVTRHDERII
jgi:fumarate hydratase subunit alpha